MNRQNEALYLQGVLGRDDDDLDEGGDAHKAIKALIDTKFSGSNDEQGKAAALFKGLAFSDDPASNKFMKKLDEFTSGLNAEDF